MFKIALRNVFRNRRRTLLSLLLIALGAASLFVFKGYFDFIHWGMGLEAVSQYGHLQIADPGLWEGTSEGYEYLIDEKELARIVDVLRGDPAFEDYTIRLTFTGLVGTAQKSSVFVAMGVEPGSEIAGFRSLLKEGDDLMPGDQNTVLLGVGLAKALGIGVEDVKPLDDYPGPPVVVVMATTVDGQYNARNLFVVGLLETGQPEVDSRLAAVPLSFAQSILNTQSVEKVIVKLKSVEATGPARERLQRAFDKAGLELEVKTWEELAVFRRQVTDWFEAMYRFLSAAIFILVFSSILEVMTMSFFERMREIGTIRAIGTKRLQVFQMFLTEGLLIGVIGGVLGVGLGWAVGWLVNEAEIYYVPPGRSTEVPLGIRLLLENALTPFMTAVLSTLTSTLYPAWRAARLRVVEVLRYV